MRQTTSNGSGHGGSIVRTVRALVLGWSVCGASMVAAEAPLTTGTVAAGCSNASAGRRENCLATMRGFVAGYRTGLQKGIRSTFAEDPLVLQTTDGQEDTYLRYRRVADRSLCMPPEVDTAVLLGLFLDFVRGDPGTVQEPFGDVMEVVLDTAFACRESGASGGKQ